MPKVIFSPLAPAIKLISSFEIHLVCIDISSRSGRKFAGIRCLSECQDCEEKRNKKQKMWKSLSVALIVLAAVFEVSDGKLRMLFGIQCTL